MKVLINNVEIQASVELIDSENKAVKIEFQTAGKNEYYLLSELLKSKSLSVSISELELEYKAKVANYTRSYQDLLDEDTIANFSLELHEKTESDEDEWNALTGVAISTVRNWVRARSISEILIEKGLFTLEEYQNKLDEVGKRDKEEMLNYISKGIEK